MFCKQANSLWKSIYKTLDKSFGITKNMENYTMLDSTSMNCLRGTFLGHSVTNVSLPNPLVNDMFQIYTLYVLNIVLYLACKCCFPYKTGVLHLMFLDTSRCLKFLLLQKYIYNWFVWLLLDRCQGDLISWVGRRLCWRNDARRTEEKQNSRQTSTPFVILPVVLPK